MLTNQRVDTDALTRDEVRYLRKCVKHELGLRRTKPTYSEYASFQALTGTGAAFKRAKYIRDLAKTFVSNG